MPTTHTATTPAALSQTAADVKYGTETVDGLTIAYREAGDTAHPKLVLLHGFPASSHQYRNLVAALANRFHVLAPDYPGFGSSDAPDVATYAYTFDALSATMERFLNVKGFDHYGLYMQDYGGPVGFRLMSRNPTALDWMVVQNANAYEDGLSAAWDPFRALWNDRSPETEAPLAAFLTHSGIKSLYLAGAVHPELISPDNWESDVGFMQRPNAVRANLDLFYDYRTNPPLYPQWQAFLREHLPKALIFWGQGDPFFTPTGGSAYLRDLPQAEYHPLNAGHFAVEDHLALIAGTMTRFYDAHVRPATA